MDKLLTEASSAYFWLTIGIALAVNLLSSFMWPVTQGIARRALLLTQRLGSASLRHIEEQAENYIADQAYMEFLATMNACRVNFFGCALLASVLYTAKLLSYIDAKHFHPDAPPLGWTDPGLLLSVFVGIFLGNATVELMKLLRLSLIQVIAIRRRAEASDVEE